MDTSLTLSTTIPIPDPAIFHEITLEEYFQRVEKEKVRLAFEQDSSDNRKKPERSQSPRRQADITRPANKGAHGICIGIADFFPNRGRQTYLVSVENQRIIQVREAGAESVTANPEAERSPFVDRIWVARTLGMSPTTLSRLRKKLEAEGLVGRRLGGRKIMWRRDDVIAYAERKGLTGKRKPGRPRRSF